METIKTLDDRIEAAHQATVTIADQLAMSRREVEELRAALTATKAELDEWRFTNRVDELERALVAANTALAAATAPIVAQPVVAVDEHPPRVTHDMVAELGKVADTLSAIHDRRIERMTRLFGVPSGWQLVPKSPTQEMLNRAIVWTQTPHAIYAAMLAAAPAAPADGEV